MHLETPSYKRILLAFALSRRPGGPLRAEAREDTVHLFANRAGD